MKSTETKTKTKPTPGKLNGHAAKPKTKKTVKATAKNNGHKPKAKKKELTPEEVFLQAWHLIYDNYHQGKRLD